MSLTANDVAGVEFRSAPIGRRGYAREQVDEFLERIAKTLDDRDDLTPGEVHHVMFGKPMIGKRGYDEQEVDVFLDQAEDELARRTGEGARGVPCAREHDEATASRVHDRDLDRAPSTTSHPR